MDFDKFVERSTLTPAEAKSKLNQLIASNFIFYNNQNCQIKYGEKVIDVIVKKIDKTDKINEGISNAYLNKYTQEYNIEYAKGISKIEYFDFTLEFKISHKK